MQKVNMTTKQLKIGEPYKLVYPNGSKTTVKFTQIQTYSATGMPPDYIFEYISGDDTLPKNSGIPGMFFNLTPGLLNYVKITKVGEND